MKLLRNLRTQRYKFKLLDEVYYVNPYTNSLYKGSITSVHIYPDATEYHIEAGTPCKLLAKEEYIFNSQNEAEIYLEYLKNLTERSLQHA